MYSDELKKAVAELMFAFGDTEIPDEDSVECLCGLLAVFLENTCAKANELSAYKNGDLDMECLMLVVKDRPLYTNAARSVVARSTAVERETVHVITEE